MRGRVVQVEPEASAAARKILRPHLHVRAVRTGCIEERGECGVLHVKRAPVPVHQEEASLRRRGVLGRQRELRAGREHGRLDERQAELHGIVREPPRRAHVEAGYVKTAHLRERRRAVEHEDRRHDDPVAVGIGERLRHALGQQDPAVGDEAGKRRRAAVLRPVAGRRERGTRRAGPDGVREVGARGRGRVRVLHPELNADEGVGGRGDIALIGIVRLAHECPVNPLAPAAAMVTEVGERSHAEVAVAGIVGVAPAAVAEQNLSSGKRRRVGELAYDLEASVAVGAAGVQVVVEAVRILPRIGNDVAIRRIRAGDVAGAELDVAIHRVVGGRHLLNAAEVAPHVELRHRLLLALRIRDGKRHVVERGTGRVHVDPHRLQCARVLAHEFDVVARLGDVICLHGGSACVRNLRCVLAVALRGGRLQHAGADESVEVRGRHVVRGAERHRRTHPAGRRVLSVRGRERHQLRLQYGGSCRLFRRLRCCGGRHRAREIDALDFRHARAPRRNRGIELRRPAWNRAGDHGGHREGRPDARDGVREVCEHLVVRNAVRNVRVTACEDREVWLLRSGAVRLKSLKESGARRRRLEREVPHARVVVPFRIVRRVHSARRAEVAFGVTPSGHLHVPALQGKRLREVVAEADGGAGQPKHVVAANRTNLDRREGGLRGGLRPDEHLRARHDEVVVVGTARYVET